MEVIVQNRIIDINNESDAEHNDKSPININKRRRDQSFDMEDDDMGNDDENM